MSALLLYDISKFYHAFFSVHVYPAFLYFRALSCINVLSFIFQAYTLDEVKKETTRLSLSKNNQLTFARHSSVYPWLFKILLYALNLGKYILRVFFYHSTQVSILKRKRLLW